MLLLRNYGIDRVAFHDVKGVMVVKGSWEASSRMMGDSTFLSSLVNFPKEAITVRRRPRAPPRAPASG